MLVLTACPSDGGPGTQDTDDEGTGTTTAGVTVGDATQGPPGPDGGPADTTSDPATAGPGDGPTDDGPTDDGPSDATTDDGPSGCVSDDECGDATPFCSGGTCVACSDFPDPDGACASAFPSAPLCSPAGCVECTPSRADACTGDTPLCDEDVFECVGCSYHDQCTTACNLDTGACMPDAPSLWVRLDAINCSESNPGAFDSPFCTLQQAADAIADGGGIGTIMLDDSADRQPGLDVPAGTTLAIRADTGERPVIGQSPAFGSVPIRVDAANSRLYLEGVRVTALTFEVVVVAGTSVWLDRVDIVSNIGYALDVRNGAEVHLRNSVIGSNGRNSNVRAPVYVEGSTVDVLLSTIAANYASDGGVGIPDVPDSIQYDADSTITGRNSIFVSRNGTSIACVGEDPCDDPTIDTSFVDTAGLGGAGNVVDTTIGDDLAGWFVDAGGPIAGGGITYGTDFHLTPSGAALFGPIGLVEVGHVPHDLDLDPRPAQLAAEVTAGADEP